MWKLSTKRLVACAVIAAAYAVLTLILAPVAYGPLQLRISEALTILPFIAPYSTCGLFIGCFVANLLNPLGVNVLDVVFGSLATLLAGVLTAKMKNKYLAPLPPVIVNAVIIGAVLAYTEAPDAFFTLFFINAGSIALSQLLSCYVFGLGLYHAAIALKLDTRLRAR